MFVTMQALLLLCELWRAHTQSGAFYHPLYPYVTHVRFEPDSPMNRWVRGWERSYTGIITVTFT